MMKENIEELMKNALEGYELPYQDLAWQSFQKKLDGKKGPKIKKWWLASAIAVVSAISFYTFWNSSRPENNITQNSSEKNLSKNTNSVLKQPVLESNNSAKKSSLKAYKKLPSSLENLESITENNTIVSETINTHNAIKTPDFSSSKEEIFKTNSDKEKINPNDNENLFPENIAVPNLGQKCKGEAITIDNKNNIELILKTPSGREIGIDAKSSSEITLREIGIYKVGYANPKANGSFKEMENFKVSSAPTIGLTIEEEITYENGLPTLKAEVNSSEENVTWKINQQHFKGNATKSKSNEFNFFNKGSYLISAQTTNEQGCESKENKTITISEDYNLLAVNAFNPSSSDFRKSSFIPFALTVRNVPFSMVILDPDTGGIIFETTDASNAWDGVDRRDGKLVNANKAYIWKVSILKPEPNEKSEYRGTIIRIP